MPLRASRLWTLFPEKMMHGIASPVLWWGRQRLEKYQQLLTSRITVSWWKIPLVLRLLTVGRTFQYLNLDIVRNAGIVNDCFSSSFTILQSVSQAVLIGWFGKFPDEREFQLQKSWKTSQRRDSSHWTWWVSVLERGEAGKGMWGNPVLS